MALLRKNSLQTNIPRLIDFDLTTRYCERRFKDYIANEEDSPNNQNGISYTLVLNFQLQTYWT